MPRIQHTRHLGLTHNAALAALARDTQHGHVSFSTGSAAAATHGQIFYATPNKPHKSNRFPFVLEQSNSDTVRLDRYTRQACSSLVKATKNVEETNLQRPTNRQIFTDQSVLTDQRTDKIISRPFLGDGMRSICEIGVLHAP